MTASLGLAIVGFGEIARQQHLGAIRRTEGLELCAVASLAGKADGVPNYTRLSTLLAAHPEVEAVIMCQPPAARFEAAKEALLAGRHVMLEKPPGVTVSEVRMLEEIAEARGLSLFTGWHSRWGGQVKDLQSWCRKVRISEVEIVWKEDVERWHPGQDWIWRPGGFGVFDPGINALSILTSALQEPLRVLDAVMEVPEDRDTPIAARLKLESGSGVRVSADFDWRQTGAQIWQIKFHSDSGEYLYDAAAAPVESDGASSLSDEYPAMYRHFLTLIQSGQRDVDYAPLQLIGDALLCGTFVQTEPWGRQ